MKTRHSICGGSSCSSRSSRRLVSVAEALEARRLLADIVWTNRGLASDNFAATFGANAALARGVVDAAIRHWERVIDDFNWASATQFNVNIAMRPGSGVPFSGDFGAQANPNLINVDANGVPTSATIALGRGNDTTGDGQGDGAGYYLDPTPDDWAEFPNVINNFAGSANAASPANGLSDFYSLITHELGHAVGMTSAAGSDWITRIALFATDSGVDDTGGQGTLWAYNSASVGRFVLTDSDGGGAGTRPVHVARPQAAFNFNAQSYQPNVNVMNNSFNGNGRRHLINNAVAGMFADIYGYDITWPERFGSFYASLNETSGILTLRGDTSGTNSNDSFTILSENGGYTVTVDIGNDIPGTGPTDSYVSFFTDAQVSGFVIDAGDGNDFIDIRVLGSGEPVTINGGTGDDTIRIGIGDFDTNIQSDITVNGGAGIDSIRVNDVADGPGSDTYNINTGSFSKPGRTLTYDSIAVFDLDGSDNNDTYNINGTPAGMSLNISGGEGANVYNVTSVSNDLDSLSARVTIIGGTNDDVLNLHDSADTGNDTYLFDPPGGDNLNFTKPGAIGFMGMLYANINEINLFANGAHNTVNVFGVVSTALNIDLGAGNDTLVFGDDDIDAFLSTSQVSVTGGSGTDSLVLDDSSGLGNVTYVFDRTGTTGLFGQVGDTLQLRYSTVEAVRLDANTNPNGHRIDGLPTGVALSINASLGNDTLYLGDGDVDTDILGSVAFDGFLGASVIINDQNDGVGSDVYVLNGASFTKGISSTHTFNNINSVDLYGSENNDTYTIGGTFGYTVTLRAGVGDDNIVLGGGNLTGMGNVTVYGGDGSDSLTINDTSASSDRNILVDQTGGLPFVSTFNGNLLFLHDSIASLDINAGPMNDTLTTINAPQFLRVTLRGNNGNDTFDIQGHRTANLAIQGRVTVNSGTGDDTLIVDADNVGSGALAAIENNESFATLNISDGGELRLGTGNLLLEVTNSVVMGSTNAELDLRDGRFVRRGNPNTAFYQPRLAAGYANGAWNGEGINSSTAAATPGRSVGYARGSDLFAGATGTVSGTFLNANDLYIAYTIAGDANLDRAVNFDDLLVLAQNYSATGRHWFAGNFNYDATSAVNFDDLLILAQNYGQAFLKDAAAPATQRTRDIKDATRRLPIEI